MTILPPLHQKGLENLGVQNFKVLINDRSVFANLNIADSEKGKVIRAVDKLKKIGRDGVIDEIVTFGIEKEKAVQTLDQIENLEAPESIKKIFGFLRELGIEEDKVVFSPTLARGLDYYTGTIFEVEIDGYLAGSVAGGGRYDNLIGMFTNQSIPAVGAAFGFDRLIEATEELDLFPKELSTSKVLVTVPSREQATESIKTAQKLRDNCINTEIYLDGLVSVDKQLKYADKKGIPFVVLFAEGKITLKDMKNGEKSEVSLKELIKKLGCNCTDCTCENCPADCCKS